MLAITDHPLNVQFLLRLGLDRIAARYPDRVRIYPWTQEAGSPTCAIVRAADAVLLDQSKCVSLATFFGTPIVHVGDSVMADWLNATPLEALRADTLAARGLPAPDRHMARRWFGWHFGMRLLRANEATVERLEARIFQSADAQDAGALIDFLAPWFTASVEAAEQAMLMPPPLAGGSGQLAA